jgi:type II secretion system protein G
MHGNDQRRVPTEECPDGFSLIELLIVVTVIGILAAIAIPAMNTAMEKSRQRSTMANMRTIGNHLQIYQNDTSFYPAGTLTIDGVATALLDITNTPMPTEDAWHNDFDYASDGVNAYSVESYGRDGVPGANISPAQANNFDLDIVLSNGQFSAAVD